MDVKEALRRNLKRGASPDGTNDLREAIGKRVGHRKHPHPPPRRAPGRGNTAHADRGATRQAMPAPAAEPTPSPAADDGVKRGDRGAEVAEVQTLLRAAGYYHAAIGGNFGPQTDAALRAFQRDHGLPDDGTADAQTLEALRAAAPSAAAPDGDADGDGDGAPGAEPAPPAGAGASAAISYGMSVLGAPYAAINPYRFGEVPWPGGSKVDIHGKVRGPYPAGTQVFDCSGFVVACWKAAGVDLLAHGLGSSANVAGNKTWLIPIGAHELQPGDLVVNPGHIVMYIGNHQVIQSTPNGGVKISDAGGYVKDGCVCRRVPI
jgi:peptidoglycan hydrolase-like protein with peptidoglycan-binding domain